MTFRTAFANTIQESLGNNFDDNYDYYRFGKKNEIEKKDAAGKLSLRAVIGKMLLPRRSVDSILKSNTQIIGKFDYLYKLLTNETEKELLVKILAYRILGYKKVKLPANNEKFWKTMLTLEKTADKDNFISIDFMNWKLYFFDLQQLGFPLKLYNLPIGIYIIFVAKQYEYNSDNVLIKVDKDDIVIDAGGGWGDTALRFAHQAGRNGKIYSFEFIPSNVELMQTMIKLNPEFKDKIEVVQKALWNESGLSLFSSDNGPGSNIVFFNGNEQTGIAVKTVSIDDFVAENNLPKVDFIKMDIEGSELNALKGAEKTLRKYRPKLAISLYHKLDDFRDIPLFIKSLDIGYKLYLGHYTIHQEETVLYASILSSK